MNKNGGWGGLTVPMGEAAEKIHSQLNSHKGNFTNLEIYEIWGKNDVFLGGRNFWLSCTKSLKGGNMQITVEVNRFYIETKQRNKKGNAVMIPIDVRKMRLDGDFIGTNCYEINLLKRHGEKVYSIRQVVPPKKELWPQLNTRVIEVKIKWKKEGNYTREQFVEWCRKRGIGEAWVVELETRPPEKKAA
jgi:hypothetical protein